MGNTFYNPFVGLRPFESDESLLFFGRQQPIAELLQRLHRYHFVAVVGGSGSGKSSLVRAGLIPGLNAGYLVNNIDQWIISIMKPGQSPLCNMADALLAQLPAHLTSLTAAGLYENIQERGADAVLDVLNLLYDDESGSTPNFFLLVDQFEELFRFASSRLEWNSRNEAAEFVNILLALSTQTQVPAYVVITMRSDFIGDCARFYGLSEALNQSQYLVPRLSRIQLKSAIEGPVKLYRSKIHPSLTAKLLNDAELIDDGLPILQHALMRMWDYQQQTDPEGILDLTNYEHVGGMEKALSNHAEEALAGMEEKELLITRKLFQALTTVDENGRKIRRPVLFSELPAITGAGKDELERIINRFIEDNRAFLVLSRVENKDDKLIDISHESLIRQWSRLQAWVDEEAASGRMLLRLNESAALYREQKKDLLSGVELQRVLQWYRNFHPTEVWASHYRVEYENSIRYLQLSELEWKAQKKKEEARRRKKLRTFRLLFAAAMLVSLLVGWLALRSYRAEIRAQNQLAIYYWSNSQLARSQQNSLKALHLIAEAGSISHDKKLYRNMLIDVQPSMPQAVLEHILPHQGPVRDARFSTDGKLVITAGYDSTVRIRNLTSDALPETVIRTGQNMNSAVFSHNGKWFLTAGFNNQAVLWSTATHTPLRWFPKQSGPVYRAVFSTDDQQVMTAGENGLVTIWNANTTAQIVQIPLHRKAVFDAVFNRTGKLVLMAGEDSTVCLWNVEAGKQAGIDMKHAGSVNTAVFSNDEKLILTAATDSTVCFWDAANQQVINRWKLPDKVNSAAFSPDNRFVVTACNDKTVSVWRVSDGKQAGPMLLHEKVVYQAVFSEDGTRILTACDDSTARIWTFRPEESHRLLLPHSAPVISAVFSPDGTEVLTLSQKSSLQFWNAATGRHRRAPLNMHMLFYSAVYSSDARYILTAGYDSTVRIWNRATGKQEGAALLHPNAVISAVFSPDGRKILTTCKDGQARIWKPGESQPRLLQQAAGSFEYMSCAAFNADGTQVLAGGINGYIFVWDTAGQQLAGFQQLGVSITHVAFRSNGNQILTADNEGAARLWNWDTAAHTQAGPAFRHNGAIMWAAFSREEEHLVTAGYDGTARLWDIASGKQLGLTFEHRAPVNTASFSTDSRHIVTASSDSTAELWEVQGDLDLPPDLFGLQARAATGVELNTVTYELNFIPAVRWKKIKEEYTTKAREHYRICRYSRYNFWKKFYERTLTGRGKK